MGEEESSTLLSFCLYQIDIIAQVYNLLSKIPKTEKLRKLNIFSRMSSANQSKSIQIMQL